MSKSTSIDVADRIVLTLPGAPKLRGVATLVLGGIGSRLDLPYEKVDDLQLAVLSVLSTGDVERVTIEVDVNGEAVDVSIGPLAAGVARDRGLRRVLERLVDGVEPSPRTSGDGAPEEWISLRLGRVTADPPPDV
jgi:hypothetical protein